MSQPVDSKTEVLDFMQKLQEDIQSDRLVAKHIRVLVSSTDHVIGEDVYVKASPGPALVTDTIYMCMGALCGLRDQTLRDHANDPDILEGFRSFIADIDRNLQSPTPVTRH